MICVQGCVQDYDNLLSKDTFHNNPTTPLMCCDLNGQQQLPRCPTPDAAAYNSHPAYWQIITCGDADSEAPWGS
jgi:hypothetical protein